MTRTAPVQQVDLTAPEADSLTYVEVLTPAGIVRVNANLVELGTGRPVVVIEVEPDIEHWNTRVSESRAEITLTRREGGQS